MAYFKKYNGYYVKDAEAIKHVNLNGQTVTTTDADGNTVDQFNLPGGDSLITSATHMSYWPAKLTQAYAISSKDAFKNSNIVDVMSTCAVGQVIGSEMIGYGEIDWDDSNSRFTLSDIRALTTHGWQTFTKDVSESGATTRASYRNDLLRQFRPINYKAFLNVGMKGKSITISAGYKQTILRSNNSVYLRDPGGVVIGCVSIAKAIPTIGWDADGAGLLLYFGMTDNVITDVVAYNPTSSDITLQSFVLELEVTLYNTYAQKFFFEAPNVPFIEGINCTSLTGDGTTTNMIEQTSVVVKHHDNTSGKYLIEAKLTLNTSTGEWSWVKSRQQNLGQGPIEGNNHNLIYTFDHTIVATDFSTIQAYTSAVAYAIGVSGSSIGATDGFTDAIPIPAYVNVTPS